MRRFYFTILAVLCGCFLFSIQAKDKDKEKRFQQVQEFKMKYLAQEMELTEKQKKEFFQVYEEMSKEKRNCYKEAVSMERKVRGEAGATEEDYQKVREAMNKANAESAAIEKKYDEKLSEFLSEKQIYKMKEAEKEFRAKMEEMKHNNRKKGKK